jgi:hypothetical protein
VNDLVNKGPMFNGTGDEPSTNLVSGEVRDARAIAIAGHLLMAGVALERQVKTLVKARARA